MPPKRRRHRPTHDIQDTETEWTVGVPKAYDRYTHDSDGNMNIRESVRLATIALEEQTYREEYPEFDDRLRDENR